MVGCSRSATYVTPDGKVVVQNGKPGQGQITISGKDGSKVSYNAEGGKVPDDYPKDVPVPSNVKVLMSTSANANGQQGYSLVLESADTTDNLTAFYKKGFVDNGWTVESTTSTAEMTIFGASKDKRTMMVQIVDSNGKRSINQTVANKS